MPKLAPADERPGFCGERALILTTEFVTRFPVRADGDTGRISSAQGIVGHLVAMGYDPG